MAEFYAFETNGVTDEWGNYSVQVLLVGVVVFTFDTGEPAPTSRLIAKSKHLEAMHSFANRLARLA